jgi:Recombination endonuclease VII
VKKRCAGCKQYKEVTEFPRKTNSKDGFHCYCKSLQRRADPRIAPTLARGSRHYHLKRRYGISADEFDELVKQQGGVCPICGRADPEHVDHSHEARAVRGILCFNCNGGPGQFRGSTDALRDAADYLEMSDAPTRELGALTRARAREVTRGAV